MIMSLFSKGMFFEIVLPMCLYTQREEALEGASLPSSLWFATSPAVLASRWGFLWRGSCFGLATSSSLTLHPHVLHGYILISYTATSSSLTRLLLKMAEPGGDTWWRRKHSSLILYTYSLFSGIFQVI